MFAQRSVGELLQGETWSPTAGDGKFGLLPLILGSLYVTVGALVLSVPLGLACAVFIAEVCPAGAKEYLKPAVEMLAAIPSVVYGFLGLLLIGPFRARCFPRRARALSPQCSWVWGGPSARR